MANLNFVGKITQISEPQTGKSAKGEWSKTTIVVEDDNQYPNSIAFEAFNKPEVIEGLSVGMNVDVLYNAKTSEYNGRTFNSLSVWKVEVKDGSVTASSDMMNTTTRPVMSGGKSNVVDEGDSDLPF